MEFVDNKLVECTLCAETFTNSDKAKDIVEKILHSKFDSDIKAFCDLFSLPQNYFQIELSIPNAILAKCFCSKCRNKIHLISTVSSEIDKLQKQLDELKKCVQKDLTRMPSQGRHGQQKAVLEVQSSDFSFLHGQIRQQLRRDIQRSLPSRSKNVARLENVVCHVKPDLFFDSVPASPVNSHFIETEDDPFKETEGDPDTLIDDFNQDETETDLYPENLEETEESESESDAKNGLKAVKHFSRRTGHQLQSVKAVRSEFSLKSGINLTPKEACLVREAGLKDCSIVVARLIVPTRSKLKQGKPFKQVLTCEICNRVCESRSHVQHHKSLAHPEKYPFLCTICNQGFSKESIYERHQQFHADNFKYRCQTCSETFQKKQDLLEHYKIHPYERPSKVCKECGQAFKRTNGLMLHQRRSHGAPFPFICGVCQKGFNYEKNMKDHELGHTGEKNFMCDKCPSRFHSQSSLAKHVNDMHVRHTDPSEVFKCEICSRNYKRQASLNMHMRTHTGERPWVCDVCGMSFVYKINLENHLSVHTNERPFLCQECGFSFRLKGKLRAHVKIHEMYQNLRANHQNIDELGTFEEFQRRTKAANRGSAPSKPRPKKGKRAPKGNSSTSVVRRGHRQELSAESSGMKVERETVPVPVPPPPGPAVPFPYMGVQTDNSGDPMGAHLFMNFV